MLLILFILSIFPDSVIGSCVVNTNGCGTCESASICSNCTSGYYLKNDQCQTCSIGCILCISKYTCYSTCRSGFLGLNNNCVCQKGKGINSSGDCVTCSQIGCQQCYQDYQKCEKCSSSTGIDKTTFQCSSCSDPECISCPEDYTDCKQCSPEFSMEGGSCFGCQISGCISCISSKSICDACQSGKGLYGMGCQACDIVGCVDCRFNALSCELCDMGKVLYGNTCAICSGNCTQCEPGTGINVTDFTCIPCSSLHLQCQLCNPKDAGFCITCNPNFGLHKGVCEPCTILNCKDCGVNFRQCVQCHQKFGIKDGYKCSACPSNCLYCSPDYKKCSQCQIGYFNFFGKCVKCDDDNCVDCRSGVQICITCKEGFEKVISPLHDFLVSCRQICGDRNTTTLKCDNLKSVSLDGCDDNCQVMPDFDCLKINGVMDSTECSYNKTLQFTLKTIVRIEGQNKLQIQITVFPKLWAFSQLSPTEMKSLLKIEGANVQPDNVAYNTKSGQFTFTLSFTQNMFKQTSLDFHFEPQPSRKYFATTPQSSFEIILPSNYEYYSESVKNLMNILSYVSYILIAIAWICCALSLCLRKLRGLDSLMVLQVAIVCFIFLQSKFLYFYNSIKGSRFGLGANFWISDSDEQNISGTFAVQFGFSAKLFSNNFNICLTLQFLSVIAMIVTFIKYKRYEKKHENEEVFVEVEKKHKQVLQKYEGHYNFCLQSFVYTTMTNLINFIVSTALFIKFGTLSHTASWALLAIYSVSLLAVLILFLEDPHGFGFFRYSFRMTYLTFYHFWIFIFGMILFSCLSVSLVGMSYITVIPIGLLLLEVIIFRPYVETYENLHTGFCLAVMGSFCGFKIYVESLNENNLNSTFTFVYFMLNFLVFLPLVYILCILSLVWSFLKQRQSNMIITQVQLQKYKILKELVVTNVKQKIKQESIFKQFLPNEGKLLQYSINLKSEYDQSKDKQQFYKFQRPILCQKTSKQSLDKQKLIRNNLKKQNLHSFTNEEFEKGTSKQLKEMSDSEQLDSRVQMIIKKVLVEETEYIKYKQANTKVNNEIKYAKQGGEYYLDRYDSI